MVSAGYARILLRSLLAQQWVYLKGCRPIGGNQSHHLAAWDKQHLILATARIFMLGGWHACIMFVTQEKKGKGGLILSMVWYRGADDPLKSPSLFFKYIIKICLIHSPLSPGCSAGLCKCAVKLWSACQDGNVRCGCFNPPR